MHPLEEYLIRANMNLDELRRPNEPAPIPLRTIFRCAYLAAIIVFCFYILASFSFPLADEGEIVWGIIVEEPNAGNLYGECSKEGGYCNANTQLKKVTIIPLGRFNPEELRRQ